MHNEIAIISKLLLSENGESEYKRIIESDYGKKCFILHKDKFEFVHEFRIKYGKLPSKETFENTFKDIKLSVVNEPVDYYITELRASFLFSKATEMSGEMIRLLTNKKAEEAIEYLSSTLADLKKSVRTSKDINLLQTSDSRLEHYEDRKKLGALITGIPTGWVKVDSETGGWQKGELILLAGRPYSYKCVDENSTVISKEGKILTLKEFKEKGLEWIQSYNEETGKIVWSKVNAIVDTGYKEGYRVKTKSGREIIVSEDHPFLTDLGWKKLKELKMGDRLAVPSKLIDFNSSISISCGEAYLLGILTSEGGTTKGEPIFSTADKEVLSNVSTICLKLGLSITKAGKYTYRIKRDSAKENKARRLIKRYGIAYKKSKHKDIHPEIFGWTNSKKYSFIEGLYDGDGSVSLRGEIHYTTASKKLAEALQTLLLSVGIFSSFRKYSELHYRVTIDSSCKKEFRDKIYLIERKRKRIKFTKYPHTYSILFRKDMVKLFKQAMKIVGTKKTQIYIKYKSKLSFSEYYSNKKNMSRKLYKNIVEFFYIHKGLTLEQYKFLSSFVIREVFMDTIISIKKVGKIKMVDLEVEGTHNFIVNNIIVHNSWCLIFWAVYAWNNNFKVLLFTKEMSHRQLSRRIDAVLTKTRFKDIKTCIMPDQNFEDFKKRMQSAYCDAFKPDFIIIDSSGKYEYELDMVRDKIKEYKPDIVFIDGIYLFRGKGNAEWEKQKWVSNNIKDLAMDEDIPIVGTIQLNRAKNKNSAQGEDIAYSDSWTQDADNVIGLTRLWDKIEEKWLYQVRVEGIKFREAELMKFVLDVDLEGMLLKEDSNQLATDINETTLIEEVAPFE